MDLNSLNKLNYHFVCTNYGSNKDGIGHYTSKVVAGLKNKNDYQVYIYSRKTFHLSNLNLFLSFRMSKEIFKLIKKVYNNSEKSFIILEYPFVEYNPILFFLLIILKFTINKKSKIVVSLHEYNRTKKLRKFFIKGVILLSDIVLYTDKEDVKSFNKKNRSFIKRSIPANIQPSKEFKKEIIDNNVLNLCFFGIVNFSSKKIDTMITAWEDYLGKNLENKIIFHFISSSNDLSIKNNKNIQYHYNLNDKDVSKLLSIMHYIILPIMPKVSINNGSLSVGCIHKCIPIGVFDSKHFNKNFGISMKNYNEAEFIRVYKLINNLELYKVENKRNVAFKYGLKKSIKNTISAYMDIK